MSYYPNQLMQEKYLREQEQNKKNRLSKDRIAQINNPSFTNPFDDLANVSRDVNKVMNSKENENDLIELLHRLNINYFDIKNDISDVMQSADVRDYPRFYFNMRKLVSSMFEEFLKKNTVTKKKVNSNVQVHQ